MQDERETQAPPAGSAWGDVPSSSERSDAARAPFVEALRRRRESELARQSASGPTATAGTGEAPAPPPATTRARGSGRWAIAAALLLGCIAGVALASLLASDRPLAALRLAAARLVMPADVRPRFDVAMITEVAPGGAAVSTGEPAPSGGTSAAAVGLDGTAAAIEERLLAMLEQSDLAMRQLAELDLLRERQIARLEAARLPAWAATDDEAGSAEARILEMMMANGALEATLDQLEAPGKVVGAEPAPGVAGGGNRAGADDEILAMVGGEAGLLRTLDTLDQLRTRVASSLAAQAPATAELRSLGAMERHLRALLAYVAQVEAELGGATPEAAAAIPLPPLEELPTLAAEEPIVDEIEALVARAEQLHARAGALARP